MFAAFERHVLLYFLAEVLELFTRGVFKLLEPLGIGFLNFTGDPEPFGRSWRTAER